MVVYPVAKHGTRKVIEVRERSSCGVDESHSCWAVIGTDSEEITLVGPRTAEDADAGFGVGRLIVAEATDIFDKCSSGNPEDGRYQIWEIVD